jgi:putative transposase
MTNVCRDFDAELLEFNGEHDHVHLLINYPPKVALSNLVASLKGVSSRMLQQQFGDFHPWLKRRGVLWSPSNFASSCGGAPIAILRNYFEISKQRIEASGTFVLRTATDQSNSVGAAYLATSARRSRA